jgi:hypothetical protein
MRRNIQKKHVALLMLMFAVNSVAAIQMQAAMAFMPGPDSHNNIVAEIPDCYGHTAHQAPEHQTGKVDCCSLDCQTCHSVALFVNSVTYTSQLTESLIVQPSDTQSLSQAYSPNLYRPPIVS